MPSQEEILNFMQNFGIFGILIYILWGIISVIITPLNFSLLGMSTGFIYGTFIGGLINWLCKIIGTFISFIIAQNFGRKLVEKLLSKKNLGKYDYLIQNESSVLLYATLCFIPFTPSDSLAYILGLSKLKKSTFLAITIIGNSGTAFSLAYIGSGGALKNPWFIVIMIIAIVSGLYYIHKHRKKYALHK